MKLERTKNAIKNSLWGMINKIVFLFFPFILRVVIIRTLGVEYLGLNGLFSSVLSILNLAELGVGSAIVYSMYNPIAHGDSDTICALMHLYKRLYRIISIGVLLIGVILLPFFPMLISGEVPKGINIYILFTIYLINVVVSYWLFAYRTSILHAYQRNDIISKTSLITNILLHIFQIIILCLWENYYYYVVLLPIFSIASNVINAIISKKLFPQYRCHGKVTREQQTEIEKRVKGLVLMKVSYASRNALDSIVISAILGLTAVAMYNNYYYLCSAVSGFLLVFMISISAGIGNSLETETVEKTVIDLKNITFIYMTMSVFCFSCFLALFQPFIRLWVGESLVLNESIMIMVSVYFLVDKSENVIGQYYDAAGLWWNGKWKGLIEIITNLSLNIILCKTMGLFGIVLATTVTILFISIPFSFHFLYSYRFNKSGRKALFEHYGNLFKFFVVGLLPFFLARLVPYGENLGSNILNLIIRAIIAFSSGLGVYCLLFIRSRSFLEAKKWFFAHAKVR